jgi:RimJ/RimL family protein N-acetyltransferase
VGGQQPAGLLPLHLETPRLLLRPPEQRDIEDVFEIHQGEEVTRYLPYASWTSMEQAVAWFHRVQGGITAGDVSYMVVVDKASGRVAGSALLRDWDAEARKVEVGYMLGRPYWGKGLAREAVRALMNEAFVSLDLRRMEAQIDARNLLSQRLVESMGFQREALLRENWCDKGEVSDSTIYGLLRREWEALRLG